MEPMNKANLLGELSERLESTKKGESIIVDKSINGLYVIRGNDEEQEPCFICGRMAYQVTSQNKPICDPCVRRVGLKPDARVICKALGGKEHNRHFAAFVPEKKTILTYPAGSTSWSHDPTDDGNLERWNMERVRIAEND